MPVECRDDAAIEYHGEFASMNFPDCLI